ncbi:2Fe-2S iron-sulfur cluster binding domain-containing protein [Pseudomaricurvus alkylphenolicus]|uniref:2Fe-2S iron-sulfur cluster-binding protein n=1 Tax=Pseudomaricurvus alkylphenolicus TaxID=1306991 RepID=UPI00142475C8|nr:2Fe-2S iron-sulfur cluster-binding protein [Pseudomaricurvus alkylphenolicus]NIB38440.1 2Fe-2S iron-sulfur cluster binding domain-containing protein [Pseudomaricurvus alkylphenolicus]
MGTIYVTDLEGEVHKLAVQSGGKLMEAIRDAGFPIEAICGGEGSCATCHVHVPPEWYDKLPKAEQTELDFVEVAMTYEPGMSRLSCQIQFNDSLEGLHIQLTEED